MSAPYGKQPCCVRFSAAQKDARTHAARPGTGSVDTKTMLVIVVEAPFVVLAVVLIYVLEDMQTHCSDMHEALRVLPGSLLLIPWEGDAGNAAHFTAEIGWLLVENRWRRSMKRSE